MLPARDVRLQDAFSWQIGDPAKVTRVDELVFLVSPIATEYLAVRIIGQPDRRIEHMVLDIDLGLWERIRRRK